jgi:hypothetical protein
MTLNKNQKAFLALLREGLWESGNPGIQIDRNTDWQVVYRLATEQSVLGLVLAGLEHSDVKPPQALLLQWIGEVQLIEQRNKEMNVFVADLIEKLRKADIYALLVKGQGIAQCYEKPLWRCSGDVDLLLSESNYYEAQRYLDDVTCTAGKESRKNKEQLHLEYNIGGWVVELHGTMHANLSRRMDRVIDDAQHNVFYRGEVRSWVNRGSTILLPSSNNDVIFVFIHILQHFFQGGIGLRQVCDLSRLFWTYRDEIDRQQLHSRLKKMGAMTEWKAFASLMVDSLGLPEGSMPFYEKAFKKKGEQVLDYILYTGIFGRSIDVSYQRKYKGITRKVLTFCKQFKDSMRLAQIFPYDAPKFLIKFFLNGLFAIHRD